MENENPRQDLHLLFLGILLSISVTLAMKFVFLTKLLTSGIFLSTLLVFFSRFDLSVSYVSFKTSPVVSILSALETNLLYSTFFKTLFFTTLLNFVRSLGTGFDVSISNLSTSVFKLAKLDFNAKLLISICNIFLYQFLVHN